jgi:hypothetical protein
MSTPNLLKLWNDVKNYGFHVRTNDLDGLASWNTIKKEFIVNKVIGGWDIKIVGVYAHMKTKLGIKEEPCEIDEKDPSMQKKIWEKHHFYLQHARIPVLNINEPRLYRLMQVAYNAGQLKALFDDKFYTEDMVEYYDKNNLGKLGTYMSEKYLVEFENSINNEFMENVGKVLSTESGGAKFEKKYYKYKAKYLAGKRI